MTSPVRYPVGTYPAPPLVDEYLAATVRRARRLQDPEFQAAVQRVEQARADRLAVETARTDDTVISRFEEFAAAAEAVYTTARKQAEAGAATQADSDFVRRYERFVKGGTFDDPPGPVPVVELPVSVRAVSGGR